MAMTTPNPIPDDYYGEPNALADCLEALGQKSKPSSYWEGWAEVKITLYSEELKLIIAALRYIGKK